MPKNPLETEEQIRISLDDLTSQKLVGLAASVGRFAVNPDTQKMPAIDQAILFGTHDERHAVLEELYDLSSWACREINQLPAGSPEADRYTIDIAAADLRVFAITGNLRFMLYAIDGLRAALAMAEEAGVVLTEEAA